MGVALDSFVQLVGIAGLVAIILLAFCLVTRIRRGVGNRGVFQRMPLLLPSFAFVMVTLLVLQSSVLPISSYRGGNQRTYIGALHVENMSFTVYESGIVYTDTTQIQFQSSVEEDEYFLVHVEFIENGTVSESIDVNLTQTLLQPNGNFIYDANLNPGTYSIQANGTLYLNGVAQEDYSYLNLVFYQAIQPTFIPEIVDWSSYQFILFMGCIFFIIGGFCIGQVDRERRSEEDIDQEPPRGDEYIRPFH